MLLIKDCEHNCATLIFGVGLIGRAIGRRLSQENAKLEKLGWDWRTGCNADQATAIEYALDKFLGGALDSKRAVEIVWSAGEGGFGITKSEARAEFRSFRKVVLLAEHLARKHQESSVNVSMLSSAGGLFEGQCLVRPDSIPAPKREYGVLKLRQEQLLKGLSWTQCRRVFRLSTVIGPSIPGVRHGLVSTVLTNTLAGRVTQIYGYPDTLRDYIWIEDVARLVQNRLFSSRTVTTSGYVEEHLVSARPVSLQYLLVLIECHVRKKVLKQFVHVTNARSTTFSPEIKPSDLRVTPVEEAISNMHFTLTGYA